MILSFSCPGIIYFQKNIFSQSPDQNIKTSLVEKIPGTREIIMQSIEIAIQLFAGRRRKWENSDQDFLSRLRGLFFLSFLSCRSLSSLLILCPGNAVDLIPLSNDFQKKLKKPLFLSLSKYISTIFGS